MNRLMYLPAVYNSARAEGIQIFANVILVAYGKSQSTSIVVHLCMLPHGDGNQQYCPVGITPTDLFSLAERKMYGL